MHTLLNILYAVWTIQFMRTAVAPLALAAIIAGSVEGVHGVLAVAVGAGDSAIGGLAHSAAATKLDLAHIDDSIDAARSIIARSSGHLRSCTCAGERKVLVTSMGGVGTNVVFNRIPPSLCNDDGNGDELKHRASTYWAETRCALPSGEIAFEVCRGRLAARGRTTKTRRCDAQPSHSSSCTVFVRAVVITGNVLHALESVVRRFDGAHIRTLLASVPRAQRGRETRVARCDRGPASERRCADPMRSKHGFCSDALAERCTRAYLDKGIEVGRDVSGFGNYVASWHRAANEPAQWPPLLFFDAATASAEPRALCRFLAAAGLAGFDAVACEMWAAAPKRAFHPVARGDYSDAQRSVLDEAQQHVDALRQLGSH